MWHGACACMRQELREETSFWGENEALRRQETRENREQTFKERRLINIEYLNFEEAFDLWTIWIVDYLLL